MCHYLVKDQETCMMEWRFYSQIASCSIWLHSFRISASAWEELQSWTKKSLSCKLLRVLRQFCVLPVEAQLLPFPELKQDENRTKIMGHDIEMKCILTIFMEFSTWNISPDSKLSDTINRFHVIFNGYVTTKICLLLCFNMQLLQY